MNLLALDPSSSCTGYAVLTGLATGDLVDGGLVKPSLGRAAIAHLPAWEQDLLRQPELTALRRMLSMLPAIGELIDQYRPDRVAIEWPSGKIGTGAKKRARGSLTTYGAAAGLMGGYCRERAAVVAVTERQWTAGQGAKDRRQRLIAGLYPRYSIDRDAGGDLADAIGLARWCLEDPRRCGLD